MKKQSIFYLMFSINTLGIVVNCFGQVNSFDQELSRLNANTAQVFDNDISQMPIWSEKSDVLYFKKQSGKIYSINLNEAKLTAGVWHNDTIGVISLNLIKQLTPEESNKYAAKYEINYNKKLILDSVKTKMGTVVKFRHGGLVLKETGRAEKTLWTSSSVCGGVVLSPNEKYIVFYCETSGVFIMKIN